MTIKHDRLNIKYEGEQESRKLETDWKPYSLHYASEVKLVYVFGELQYQFAVLDVVNRKLKNFYGEVCNPPNGKVECIYVDFLGDLVTVCHDNKQTVVFGPDGPTITYPEEDQERKELENCYENMISHDITVTCGCI